MKTVGEKLHLYCILGNGGVRGKIRRAVVISSEDKTTRVAANTSKVPRQGVFLRKYIVSDGTNSILKIVNETRREEIYRFTP